jgi:hypothetical protein
VLDRNLRSTSFDNRKQERLPSLVSNSIDGAKSDTGKMTRSSWSQAELRHKLIKMETQLKTLPSYQRFQNPEVVKSLLRKKEGPKRPQIASPVSNSDFSRQVTLNLRKPEKQVQVAEADYEPRKIVKTRRSI